MKKEEIKVISDFLRRIIGGIWMLFGLGLFAIGLFQWNYEIMMNGLLSMILGELIDLDIRIKS